MAEGNLVVGRISASRGPAYPDCYYWIFEMRDGKVVRLTEYCETTLIESVVVHPTK
jgi:ketosteroid isomerase-like protein